MANELTRVYRVAWELYQVRRGPGVGKKTYQGVLVEGSEDATRNEMRVVLGKMRGKRARCIGGER